MNKKYRVSEFAELIGTSAKTVYKMEERNELKTDTERINGREIKVIIATDEEIEKFRGNNSFNGVINRNYEDILTDTNHSQNSNSDVSVSEMFDKFIEISNNYNERIKTLNEELIDSKSKLLLLEDKAGRENEFFKEISELKTVNEQLQNRNEQLRSSNQKVINWLSGVIILLCMVITVMVTVNVVNNSKNSDPAQKNEPSQQVVVQPVKKARR